MLAWSVLEEVYAGPRWLVFLAALAARAGEGGGDALVGGLALAGRHAATVRQARAHLEQLLAVVGRRGVAPSEVVGAVERTEPALVVVTMAAAGEEERRLLRHALTSWMHAPAPVTGAQLRAAGITPGPAIGAAVRQVRAAVLDGKVGREDALEYALGVARGVGDGD